jgi:hypothetical protein
MLTRFFLRVKQDGGCQVLGVEGDPQMDALIAQIVPGLQQVAKYIHYIGSKSKVTGEGTRQPNDPDPISIAGCQVVGVEGEPQVDTYIQQK